MRRTDSTKRFGLIGIVLIVVSFLAWAFVLPRLNNKPDNHQLQNITTPPVDKQSAPLRPTSEPPKPMPPSQ